MRWAREMIVTQHGTVRGLPEPALLPPRLRHAHHTRAVRSVTTGTIPFGPLGFCVCPWALRRQGLFKHATWCSDVQKTASHRPCLTTPRSNPRCWFAHVFLEYPAWCKNGYLSIDSCRWPIFDTIAVTIRVILKRFDDFRVFLSSAPNGQYHTTLSGLEMCCLS